MVKGKHANKTENVLEQPCERESCWEEDTNTESSRFLQIWGKKRTSKHKKQQHEKQLKEGTC